MFDLAEKLRGVSNINTREQIEYIPFELLDPAPNNFYSIDGINELADSIATVGLVHPLRVRQNGERYTVTSGHRRRAAIQLLMDSGEDWSGGVPCVVDRGENEPEFEELKLIFANRQRQKTSAELSREAEKTEQLLCALKEKGFDFPGRMQDHVAAAMGVKAAKLKRLHAIRNRAQEYVLEAYDKGEINEAVAYELSQAPQDLQKMIVVQVRHANRPLEELTADQVDKITNTRNTMANRGCHFNKNVRCAFVNVRMEEALRRRFSGDKGGNCQKGGCCKDCPALLNCESWCCKLERDRQLLQAAQEQRREEIEKTAKELAAQREQARTEAEEYCSHIWARIKKAAEASGVGLGNVFAELCETHDDIDQALRFANGTEKDTGFAAELLATELEFLATSLHCSTDFLLGRTEEPGVNRGAEAEPDGGTSGGRPLQEPGEIEPVWIPGAPEALGRYMCLLRGNADKPEEPDKEFRADIREDGPYLFNRPMIRGYIITAYWPLPPLGEHMKEV